jgi:DNA-binding transcriptional ArsR family regulator
MTVLKVDTDNMSRIRFALSPMAETVAATIMLGSHRRPSWLAQWLDRRREEFDSLTSDPGNAAFIQMLTATRWLPDFMTPPPTGMQGTFAEELVFVTTTSPQRARNDLVLAAGGACPSALDHSDVARCAGEILSQVWTRFIEPEWATRRAVLERDVVHRAGLLATYGWARSLEGLGSTVCWLGQGRIQVNNHRYPDEILGDAELLLVPCSFPTGWLAIDPPRAYALVYPARGPAAMTNTVSPNGLERLIGATRTRVLRGLDTPASTSQLAAQFDLSLATVSDHLTVLREAGIVTNARAGRSVLYFRTDLGDKIVGVVTRSRDGTTGF